MHTNTRIILSVATCALMLAFNPQALAGKHSTVSEAPKPQATSEAPKAQDVQQDVNNEKVSLGSYVCKDIMRLSGDERDIALSFMHGYYLGKKGATDYVAGVLGKASDDFMEYCLDHPNDNALEIMGKFLK